MTFTPFVSRLLAAICIVNGLQLADGHKRSSPPSEDANPYGPCGQKLYQCLEKNVGKYIAGQSMEGIIENIRTTPARDVCNDLRAFESCQTAAYSTRPCDQFYRGRTKAVRERFLKSMEQFCGRRLDELEENKNCILSQHFYEGFVQCEINHTRGRTCNHERFIVCLDSLTHDNADCGPGAVPLIHELVEALIYVADIHNNGQLCPSQGKAGRTFLNHFLKHF